MPNKSLEEMVIEIAADNHWGQGDVLIMACEFMEKHAMEPLFMAWLVEAANEQDAGFLRDEIATDEDYDSGLTPEDIAHDGRVYYPEADDDHDEDTFFGLEIDET